VAVTGRWLKSIAVLITSLNTNDIHGYQLRDDSINETFERIIAMNLEERKKVPGINKERADIIVGGLIPVILLMNYFGFRPNHVFDQRLA
jgi:exopolyphosphatase/pppGpp-phosphohydrolase